MKCKLTNGVSFGFTYDAEDTDDTREVTFVGASDTPVAYDLAVVCNNATVEKNGDVYTITPLAEGRVDVVAQRSVELK